MVVHLFLSNLLVRVNQNSKVAAIKLKQLKEVTKLIINQPTLLVDKT